MAASAPIKDQLFNAAKVEGLAGRFAAAAPGFDAGAFADEVVARFPELELKQRIDWIAACLLRRLPDRLEAAAPILLAALPERLDPELTDNDFGEFITAPLGEVVVALGVREAPDLSLDLLEEITQRFSMEWAIRPFLNAWPERVLDRMQDWAGHPNYHVRRLVSEGTRPRLPWGQGIGLPPDAALPLLDRLHGDPTRYVTRSVANHLNDVTRTHPDAVLARLADWRAQAQQTERELGWMTPHALRGLVREGHPGAMAMLGYDPGARIGCDLSLTPDPVRIGEVLEIGCVLTGRQGLPILADYVLHFARPGGGTRRKVHKLGQGRLDGDGTLRLAKRHRLHGDATTYRLHPGPHRIELQVNGRIRAEAVFDLQA